MGSKYPSYQLAEGKSIYFASDFHLGVPNEIASRKREQAIVKWLTDIFPTTQELYLLGDLFDFWFEHKYSVPKGYVRVLAAIAKFTDAGIPVHVFTGNHDMWMFGYLEKEIGVKIYRAPIQRIYNGKKFYIGHGDGLGPGDHGYKFIKKVFANSISQWLFARLHPNFSFWLANYWSKKSRIANAGEDEKYMGDDKEFLVQFCKQTLEIEHFDYFIFGHRHLILDIPIGESRYINLGEWVSQKGYAKFSENGLEILKFIPS